MSIAAFLLALEHGLRISYVESNYEQIQGTDEIKRADEEFSVTQFDPKFIPSSSIYQHSEEEAL